MDEMNIAVNWTAVAVIGLVLLSALIVYYVSVTRALIAMLRASAPSVMLVFTYLSLIPLPPFIVLGIINLIVWHKIRSDLLGEL
ncbi:MAG: hypothetical protein QNJ07_09450 [Woeseiaceae bacterium]|nr:hypothetical protein [Woeseiaceae bacterium]